MCQQREDDGARNDEERPSEHGSLQQSVHRRAQYGLSCSSHRLATITMHPPIVQLSLDLTSLEDALETAAVGVAAGVDWLEAGTPLILAHGAAAVQALHARFPDRPIVADLKIMDGGYLEAEMMAQAGASLVVVMGR